MATSESLDIVRKLELDQVLQRLSQRCRFSVASERALELGPSGDVTTVKYLLSVTAEAVDMMTSFPDVSIGGARDIRLLVDRAEKGGRLAPSDLLLVHDMVHASRNLRRSFMRLPVSMYVFPRYSISRCIWRICPTSKPTLPALSDHGATCSTQPVQSWPKFAETFESRTPGSWIA